MLLNRRPIPPRADRASAHNAALVTLVLAAMLCAPLFGCVEESVAPERALAGFRVELVLVHPVAQGYGTDAAPLAFPSHFHEPDGVCPPARDLTDPAQLALEEQRCRTFFIDIEPLRLDGSVDTSFTGTVHLRAVPGEIAEEDANVRIENGQVVRPAQAFGVTSPAGVPVRVRYAYGPTRIWVEDIGVPDGPSECSDGKDNDGNGLWDFPADPGCKSEDDLDEGSASFITGITDLLTFELPTISSVQINPDVASGPSPLTGHYVEIQGRTGHDLVVTNVVGDGFYVTDLAEQSYNSLYVFNFSYPEGVAIGDRICDVGGGVTEFNALTQLQFPSWGIQGKPRTLEQAVPNPENEEDDLINRVEIVDCSSRYGVDTLSKTLPLPDPVLLNGAMIRDLTIMEKLEGSLVTVEGVELSTFFINCDDNGSGRIETSTEEASCRNECNNDPYCTELSSLYGFDQWRGRTEGAEISVSSSELVAGFDVLAGCTRGLSPEGRMTYQCPERALRRVTGSLRQIVPTCDKFGDCFPEDESVVLFIIDPRFKSDIIE